MKSYSIPALIIATICLTIAISDSFSWVKRKKRSSDFAFILVCLGGALFCLCCAGEYSVDVPAQSVFWLKGQVLGSTLSGFALLWLVRAETRLVPIWILCASFVWMALSFLSQLVDLGDLCWISGKPLVVDVALPFGLHFMYQEVARGPILYAIAFTGFALVVYTFAVVIRFRSSGDRKVFRVLFSAAGFVVAAQVLDFLIGIGALSFVYLLEYAWLATIVIVGIKRLNDSIEAEVTSKVLEKVDRELKLSQTTLAGIIESTEDMIWAVDAGNSALLSFNDSFRQHFSPGKTIEVATRFEDLLETDYERATWKGIFQLTLSTGSSTVEYLDTSRNRVYMVGANRLEREQHVFGVSVFAHDITQRKLDEEQLRLALSEKDVLLREVYHRTKNNMNVIISILKLQSRQMPEQRLKDAFAVAIDRIITMSLVHARLYMSGDLSRIDLRDYIMELAERLSASHALPGCQPSLEFDLDSAPVMIETAINCGMIVNELVTNSLKHAFPEGCSGTISLRLRSLDNGNIDLTIADNGVGLREGFDTKRDGSLGHRLVHTLAENSLHASLEFGSAPGLSCRIVFTPRNFEYPIDDEGF